MLKKVQDGKMSSIYFDIYIYFDFVKINSCESLSLCSENEMKCEMFFLVVVFTMEGVSTCIYLFRLFFIA